VAIASLRIVCNRVRVCVCVCVFLSNKGRIKRKSIDLIDSIRLAQRVPRRSMDRLIPSEFERKNPVILFFFFVFLLVLFVAGRFDVHGFPLCVFDEVFDEHRIICFCFCFFVLPNEEASVVLHSKRFVRSCRSRNFRVRSKLWAGPLQGIVYLCLTVFLLRLLLEGPRLLDAFQHPHRILFVFLFHGPIREAGQRFTSRNRIPVLVSFFFLLQHIIRWVPKNLLRRTSASSHPTGYFSVVS